MDPHASLVALGHALRASGYQFVTVTPETHARIRKRDPRLASSLRDVFGWSRPFTKGTLPAPLFVLLERAGALVETHGLFQSTVRFSSLAGELFVHSAHPTIHPGAVFFGPDTYRFCAAILRQARRAERVVDIGCGSGAGGILAARSARTVVLADVNEDALAFSRVNAELAGARNVEFVRSDVLAQVEGRFDFIVSNPPYMRDADGRTYRDGGGEFGERLSLRILSEALDRLAPGGTLLLYTGAPIVEGEDVFLRSAKAHVKGQDLTLHYEELDPDVFGGELENPAYAAVERIAAVVLTVTRSMG